MLFQFPLKNGLNQSPGVLRVDLVSSHSLSSLIISSPCRPRSRLLAASADMASRVVQEALAICGRITVERGNQIERKYAVRISHSDGEKNKKGQLKNIYSLTDSPQFLRVKSGWLVGRGSGTVTSNPAPAICPVDRAWYRSSWFTTPPLTQWTDKHQSKNAVLQFSARTAHLK